MRQSLIDLKIKMAYFRGDPDGDFKRRVLWEIFTGDDGREQVRFKEEYGKYLVKVTLLRSFARWAQWCSYDGLASCENPEGACNHDTARGVGVKDLLSGDGPHPPVHLIVNFGMHRVPVLETSGAEAQSQSAV